MHYCLIILTFYCQLVFISGDEDGIVGNLATVCLKLPKLIHPNSTCQAELLEVRDEQPYEIIFVSTKLNVKFNLTIFI